jgi:hypothetical protein
MKSVHAQQIAAVRLVVIIIIIILKVCISANVKLNDGTISKNELARIWVEALLA